MNCDKFTGLEASSTDEVYVGQHVEMLVEGFICCVRRRLVDNEHVIQATSIARFANWPNVNSDKIEGEYSNASRISKVGLGGPMVLEKWSPHYKVWVQ